MWQTVVVMSALKGTPQPLPWKILRDSTSGVGRHLSDCGHRRRLLWCAIPKPRSWRKKKNSGDDAQNSLSYLYHRKLRSYHRGEGPRQITCAENGKTGNQNTSPIFSTVCGAGYQHNRYPNHCECDEIRDPQREPDFAYADNIIDSMTTCKKEHSSEDGLWRRKNFCVSHVVKSAISEMRKI